MDEYIAREIKSLGIANVKLKQILAIRNDKSVPDATFYEHMGEGMHDYELEFSIRKNEAAIQLLTYWQTKLGDREYLDFGGCGVVKIEINSSWCGVFLADNGLESELYDRCFGSHSGINEFVRATYPKLLSPLLGDTSYCHAFGSFDFESCINSLSDMFDESIHKDIKIWNDNEFVDYVNKKKGIIDYLFGIANDQRVADFTKKYKGYLESIIDKNKELKQ